MRLIKTLILATVFAATFTSAASAAPVIFFGEDTNNGANAISHPNADAARDHFFSNLTGVGTQTFEGFSVGTAAPLTVTFAGAGSATLTGAGQVRNTAYGQGSGRFAISGVNYYDTNGTFVLTFSSPVSAFGFYGTDLGDFGSSLVLTLTGSNGISVLDIGNQTGGVANGSALYYGFYDRANTYTSISFADGGADVFGFDDFSIGSAAQVQPGAVPEPASWAMMILGMGAVGFVMRRRQNVRTTVSYA